MELGLGLALALIQHLSVALGWFTLLKIVLSFSVWDFGVFHDLPGLHLPGLKCQIYLRHGSDGGRLGGVERMCGAAAEPHQSCGMLQ